MSCAATPDAASTHNIANANLSLDRRLPKNFKRKLFKDLSAPVLSIQLPPPAPIIRAQTMPAACCAVSIHDSDRFDYAKQTRAFAIPTAAQHAPEHACVEHILSEKMAHEYTSEASPTDSKLSDTFVAETINGSYARCISSATHSAHPHTSQATHAPAPDSEATSNDVRKSPLFSEPSESLAPRASTASEHSTSHAFVPTLVWSRDASHDLSLLPKTPSTYATSGPVSSPLGRAIALITHHDTDRQTTDTMVAPGSSGERAALGNIQTKFAIEQRSTAQDSSDRPEFSTESTLGLHSIADTYKEASVQGNNLKSAPVPIDQSPRMIHSESETEPKPMLSIATSPSLSTMSSAGAHNEDTHETSESNESLSLSMSHRGEISAASQSDASLTTKNTMLNKVTHTPSSSSLTSNPLDNDVIVQRILSRRSVMTDVSPEAERERQIRMYTMIRHSHHYRRMQVALANNRWTDGDKADEEAETSSVPDAANATHMHTASDAVPDAFNSSGTDSLCGRDIYAPDNTSFFSDGGFSKSGLLDIPDSLLADVAAEASSNNTTSHPPNTIDISSITPTSLTPTSPTETKTIPPWVSLQSQSSQTQLDAPPRSCISSKLSPTRQVSFADHSSNNSNNTPDSIRMRPHGHTRRRVSFSNSVMFFVDNGSPPLVRDCTDSDSNNTSKHKSHDDTVDERASSDSSSSSSSFRNTPLALSLITATTVTAADVPPSPVSYTDEHRSLPRLLTTPMASSSLRHHQPPYISRPQGGSRFGTLRNSALRIKTTELPLTHCSEINNLLSSPHGSIAPMLSPTTPSNFKPSPIDSPSAKSNDTITSSQPSLTTESKYDKNLELASPSNDSLSSTSSSGNHSNDTRLNNTHINNHDRNDDTSSSHITKITTDHFEHKGKHHNKLKSLFSSMSKVRPLSASKHQTTDSMNTSQKPSTTKFKWALAWGKQVNTS